MRHLTLGFALLFTLTACLSSKQSKDTQSRQFKKLVKYMSGSFNSAAQAAVDSDYYDITLRMKPIWKNRKGTWLYVEQAVTANQEKPYRQRVYQLVQVGLSNFKSMVYTLKDEKAFIGAWRTPEKFDQLPMSGIELKEGCEVYLDVDAMGIFSGSTGQKTCPSELRGASYATSKVKIYRKKIVSWDQGFNSQDEQVWGATKGGYEFVKQKK